MQLAANLTFLFPEHAYRDRFAAARAAGFETVEVCFPYDLPCAETAELLAAQGQRLVLINTPPPADRSRGVGCAARPGSEAAFEAELTRALAYAGPLGARFVHVMMGTASGPVAEATCIANLRRAADRAPDLTFLLEPLNQVDQPGYFLSDFDLAVDLIDRIERPNVGLQWDAYHAAMIEGDALACWDRVGAHARHVQIGAPPDRREPSPHFAAQLFARLAECGYAGLVAAEYRPSTRRTEDSLGWRAGIGDAVSAIKP